MNKSAKPFLIYSISAILLVTIIFLLSVWIKINYEELTKTKDKKEQILKAEKLKKINLTAELQSASAQENIIPLAISLGLENRVNPKEIVYADSEKIYFINQKLDEFIDLVHGGSLE